MAATEQQIFMCLVCHKCLAGSFTEMSEETAVQRCDWLQYSKPGFLNRGVQQVEISHWRFRGFWCGLAEPIRWCDPLDGDLRYVGHLNNCIMVMLTAYK